MNNPTKLLPTDLIAVEVSKDAINFAFSHDKSKLYYYHKEYFNSFDHRHIDISSINGDLEILGEVTADVITFDVEPYLEELTFFEMDENKNVKHFKDYNPLKKLLHDIYCLKTTKESFYSLLQSNELYFVNPIEKPKGTDLNSSFFEMQVDFNQEKLFEEAESKVIKGKLVILKPI